MPCSPVTVFTVTKGSLSLSFNDEIVESRVERVAATRSLSGNTELLFTTVGADGCAARTAGAVIVLDTSAAVIEPIVLVRCA